MKTCISTNIIVVNASSTRDSDSVRSDSSDSKWCVHDEVDFPLMMISEACIHRRLEWRKPLGMLSFFFPLSNFFFVFCVPLLLSMFYLLLLLLLRYHCYHSVMLLFFIAEFHSEKVVEVQRGFEWVLREFLDKLVGSIKGRWEVEEVKFCYREIG